MSLIWALLIFLHESVQVLRPQPEDHRSGVCPAQDTTSGGLGCLSLSSLMLIFEQFS